MKRQAQQTRCTCTYKMTKIIGQKFERLNTNKTLDLATTSQATLTSCHKPHVFTCVDPRVLCPTYDLYNTAAFI